MNTPTPIFGSQIARLIHLIGAVNHRVGILLENQMFLFDLMIDIGPKVGLTPDQINLIRAKSALTALAKEMKKSPAGNSPTGL